MQAAPFVHFKNVISKLLPRTKSDVISTEEWTERHYQLNDPKVSFLEDRIAAMESGTSALAVKSIKSARFKIIASLLEHGQNVVSFHSLALQKESTLYKRLGIEIRTANDEKHQSILSLIDGNTKLIYLETISSHNVAVPDFIKIKQLAEERHIPIVVDNTASAGGYLIRPLKYHAHVVIESLEEYLPSSAKLKAMIIEGGTYNWDLHFSQAVQKLSSGWEQKTAKNDKKTKSTSSLIELLRSATTAQYDGYPIPNDPFSLIRRLEDLPTKIQTKSDNALRLAKYLKAHRFVQEVNYTGIPNGKGYFQALRFFQNGFGHYLSFTLNVKADASAFFFFELKKDAVLGKRIEFNQKTSLIQVSLPASDYADLVAHFDVSFLKLRDFIHLHASSLVEREFA